jgi:transcriptional regulator with PAS, ATPase and Fis domain
LQAAYDLAARAARLRVPVLVQGETGTGKELLARHVHQASGRRGAFVAVNCGALPKELFEAELFGYAGGAFTGARREGSLGLIGSADGGTLLLDEILELPLSLQPALLRFLDDQWLRPVGSTQGRQVDVQLLAATNGDLLAEAAAKRFRSDLLYRLNTVCVSLPPLRDRRDLLSCAAQLLTQLEPLARLLPDAASVLLGHAWPGNFRELRSVLARALVSGAGLELGAQALRDALRVADGASHGEGRSLLRQLTRERVRQEYLRLGNSVSATARALGISRTTVYRYIR